MPKKDEKIISIQPKFTMGEQPGGWALIDGIFKMGDNLPLYGTEMRDSYLSRAWVDEPMTAGVFSTWVEKSQTVNWKITGGKIQANFYASLLHQADGNSGWSYHEGTGAINYLATDKGSMEELYRADMTPAIKKRLEDHYNGVRKSKGVVDENKLTKLIEDSSKGRVAGLNHVDSTRMIKVGLPGMRWRYFPEIADPISIPDNNLIQLSSMPAAEDRHAGYGHCALSRLMSAKQLMLGYLNYFRQEIGDLPPELVVIINGMSDTSFQEALTKYKVDKENSDLEEFGKVLWLGSDDPMTPVDFKTVSMTSPNKSFNYQTMVEWWAKLLALNTGESVGEYWLIQHSGATKAVESIQSLKSRGKGVAKYLQEKERLYNLKIMPFGVVFEYDNRDDEQDMQREEILAKKIGNLKELSTIGVDRQEPAFTIEEVRELAKHWEILPQEMVDEDIPTVMGAMLKDMSEPTVTVYSTGEIVENSPILKSHKDVEAARFVSRVMEDMYHFNNGSAGNMKLIGR